MIDGNLKGLGQAALNLKAARSGDVLEMNHGKGTGDALDGTNELIGVPWIHRHGEGVRAAEALVQQRLSLHNGQTARGANVAEAEHRGTIRNDTNGAAARGVEALELGGLGK